MYLYPYSVFYLRVIIQRDIPLPLSVNVSTQHGSLEIIVPVQAFFRKFLRVYQAIVLRIGSADRKHTSVA